jgi:hypothetical protein
VVDATCPVCAEPFTPERYGQRYCSIRCRNRRPRTRRTPRPPTGYRAPRICPVCQREYTPTSSKQKRCSRRCGGVAHRESGELRRAWPASRLIYRTCKCGRLFIARGARKSCGTECARARQRRRDLVRYGKTPEQVDACRACGQPKPIGRKLCDPCRDQANREAKRAARRRRKARERGARCEPYTLAEIAKRDRYRCRIPGCGKRVAMSRPVPHPKAPTIDHVVPLADSGEDTRANARLAHFLCNSMRGDRGSSDQLRLIG